MVDVRTGSPKSNWCGQFLSLLHSLIPKIQYFHSSLVDLLTVRGVFFSLKVCHFIMKINVYLHVGSTMLKWGLATNGPLVPTLLGCHTSCITLFFASGTCLKRFSQFIIFLAGWVLCVLGICLYYFWSSYSLLLPQVLLNPFITCTRLGEICN